MTIASISGKQTKSFHDYFEVVIADTDDLRDEVYRIRYEVYCLELGYENKRKFPDQRERDEFDEQARHCLLRHRETGRFAGCVRLITKRTHEDPQRLPFEKHCWQSLDANFMYELRAQHSSYGEISRLAVPAYFRRRKGEKLHPIGDTCDGNSLQEARYIPHIAMGLYLAAACIGLEKGIEGAFAMMEPRLARHLRRFGIHFQQAGDLTDYHGDRAAYYITRSQLLADLHPELEQILTAINRDLKGVNRIA